MSETINDFGLTESVDITALVTPDGSQLRSIPGFQPQDSITDAL